MAINNNTNEPENRKDPDNITPFLSKIEALVLDKLSDLKTDLQGTKNDLRQDLQIAKSELREDIQKSEDNIKEIRQKTDKDFRWIIGILIAILLTTIGTLIKVFS